MKDKPLILVAEDNSGDVYLIREALSDSNFPCELSAIDDGEEVIRYLQSLDSDANRPVPDLILLDLNLPKRSGEQIFEYLKSSPRSAPVPVLVITSSDSPTDRERAALLGAAAYFTKPTDLDKFFTIVQVIRDILQSRPPRA
jgi:two-component system, chemotaxis family, response regulator Rcp1